MGTEPGGVIAAVLTPFDGRGRPDLGRLEQHIRTLATEGCHGILLLGTTGEGPSRHQPHTVLLKPLLAVRYADDGWLQARPPLLAMERPQLRSLARDILLSAVGDDLPWLSAFVGRRAGV